jgi:mono/diheme cytochrome c family protein
MGLAVRWLLVALLALGAAFLWLTRPATFDPDELPQHTPDPANGERLFHAGGCAACHGEDLAGGLELATGFGVFRVPNITPHPAAGIGGWTAAEFVGAMRNGVAPDGRHYYPAFPYTSYARMQIEDLLDLKAWLDGFAPSTATAGSHELGFPWNLRRGIGLWKLRYLDPAPVIQVAADKPLQRGRYLVEAVGHCGECHTPRDRFGGPRRDLWLAGARSPDGEGSVPNITPHDDGLADWSARDIVRYLKSGFTPDYDTAGGSMAEVQENLARLPQADLEAIAAYLAATPPRPKASQ